MATAKRPTKKIPSKKKKGNSKEIQKPLSKQEVKVRLGRANYSDEHPDSIYEKLGSLLTKEQKEWTDEETDYIKSHVRSIDNFSRSHVGLAETQQEGHLRTTIVELVNNLIEEYKCVTTLEKALCETIADNYGKILQSLKNSLE